MSEKKEKSSKLTAVQKKLIIGIVCALLGLLLIGGGIYCNGSKSKGSRRWSLYAP